MHCPVAHQFPVPFRNRRGAEEFVKGVFGSCRWCCLLIVRAEGIETVDPWVRTDLEYRDLRRRELGHWDNLDRMLVCKSPKLCSTFPESRDVLVDDLILAEKGNCIVLPVVHC
jgi:hypothetical protein